MKKTKALMAYDKHTFDECDIPEGYEFDGAPYTRDRQGAAGSIWYQKLKEVSDEVK